MLRRLLWLIVVLQGCQFDEGGLAITQNQADATIDQTSLDMRPVDIAGDMSSSDMSPPDATPSDTMSPDTMSPDTMSPDTMSPDTMSPDTMSPDTMSPDTMSPDTLLADLLLPRDSQVPDGKTPIPLSPVTVGQTLITTTAPCVDQTGASAGADIIVVDSSSLSFVNGSTTLAGAPAVTVAWVGGLPSVTVVFDPNACDLEDPGSNDSNWSSAGLLIRGATIQNGSLVLSSGTTVNDINLIDVHSNGTFEDADDFAGPDDSGLASYPQLAGPIDNIKRALIQLGF
jgi:pentapeptide MXKDX repeat protein